MLLGENSTSLSSLLRAGTGADVERPPLPTATSGDLDAWVGSRTTNDQALPSTATGLAADSAAVAQLTGQQLPGPPSATQPVKSTFAAECQGGGERLEAASTAGFGSFSVAADVRGSGVGQLVEDQGEVANTQQRQFKPLAVKSVFADKWAGSNGRTSSPQPDVESMHR